MQGSGFRPQGSGCRARGAGLRVRPTAEGSFRELQRCLLHPITSGQGFLSCFAEGSWLSPPDCGQQHRRCLLRRGRSRASWRAYSLTARLALGEAPARGLRGILCAATQADLSFWGCSPSIKICKTAFRNKNTSRGPLQRMAKHLYPHSRAQ